LAATSVRFSRKWGKQVFHNEKGASASMDKLRKLQLTELMILKEFIKICETHGLRYYVCGGTCLGAVRHGGFIPWDDDMDVAMPREDYKKFLEIAPKVISRDYIVFTFDPFPADNLASSVNPWIQIFYANKNLIMSHATINAAVKVRRNYPYLDVFPLDGLPDSKWLRAFHSRLSLMKRMCYYMHFFKEVVDQRRIDRPWYERLIIWFCNRVDVEHLFNPEKRLAAADKMLEKYSFYKQRWCCILWGGYKLKDIYPTDFFGDGVKLKFEDIEVTAPQNYDGYLKSIYGDYMALPPIDKRNRHNTEIISNEEERP
jgi:lipopolysaccharide cholinephosphotransferase